MELNPNDARPMPIAMLARRLRVLRERAGLSLRELGDEIRFSHTYIHRVEIGTQLPSGDLAAALDERFDTDGLFAELLDAARESLIRDYSRTVVSRERDAVRIQTFTSSVIPGLLQTDEYALALFRASMPGKTAEELRARVDARMKRKRVFEAEEPPYYWAIIDEAALKRPVGSKTCMAAQLTSLLQAAEQPHVTVQVLPFAQGAHGMMGGSLNLLFLNDGGTVALVESFKNGEAVQSPKGLAELTQFFDEARIQALPESESLDLARQYLEMYKDNG